MGDPREKEFVDAGHTSEEKAAALSEQERSAFVSSDGEVVDVDTIRKFVEQLDEQAGLHERHYAQLRDELEEKQEAFAGLLAQLPDLPPEKVEFLVRNVFASRRRTEPLLEATGAEALARAADDLVHGEGDLAIRFDTFCDRVEGVEPATCRSLAAELLHLSDPETYGPWARWMWNPESRTGAVPLMTMADVDLEGETPGETYVKVGEAVDSLHDRKDAMGFDPDVLAGPLGTDVAMATVHAVYTYLVLGMRMTKEFTQAIPDHPEYIRRLLGTQELHEQREPEGGPTDRMPTVPGGRPTPGPGGLRGGSR